MDQSAIYHASWRGKITEAPPTTVGVLKQITEQLTVEQSTLLLWSQDEAGNCIFLVTLHLTYSLINAKPYFFSIRVEDISYLGSFSRSFFFSFFLTSVQFEKTLSDINSENNVRPLQLITLYFPLKQCWAQQCELRANSFPVVLGVL